MSEAESTREEIMRATFRALSKHGYADLTMQAIADEFDKSKSLIHYHYDSKDDLLVAFLDYLLGEFVTAVDEESAADPRERLRWMANLVVTGVDEDATNFHTALLEVRAQAPFDEDLRAQLVENDALIRESIAETVREGIESGQFRDVDPERYAAVFRSAIEGAQSHDVILGDDAPTDEALAGIEAYLIDDLLLGDEAGERA